MQTSRSLLNSRFYTNRHPLFNTKILQNSDIMKAFLSFVLLLICPLSGFCANDDICLWLRFDHAGVIAPASVETRDIEMLDNISLSTVTIAANELRENWTGVPVTLQIVEDTSHRNGYFKIEKRENGLMEGPQDSHSYTGHILFFVRKRWATAVFARLLAMRMSLNKNRHTQSALCK